MRMVIAHRAAQERGRLLASCDGQGTSSMYIRYDFYLCEIISEFIFVLNT